MKEQIRKLVSSDVEPAFEIICASRDHMNKNGIPQWNEKYPLKSTIEQDVEKEEIFGFFVKGLIRGIIVINEHQDPEYQEIQWVHHTHPIGVIHRLAVDPTFQNQGIAGKLMDFAEARFLKNKFSSIRLDAFAQNEVALRFYDKRAYQRRGSVLFPFRSIPFHCFEKKL